MVVRYCRARLGRISGHYHAADDVAQEVCIAVLSALPRYQDMGRPFASFVFGIASHKVADAKRSASRLAIPTEDLPDGPGRPARTGGDCGRLPRGRAGPRAARQAPGEPARAAGAAGAVRAVRRGDRPRSRHVGRRRPGRAASRAGAAACHRFRGIDRLATRRLAQPRRPGPPSGGPPAARAPGSWLPRGQDPAPGRSQGSCPQQRSRHRPAAGIFGPPETRIPVAAAVPGAWHR